MTVERGASAASWGSIDTFVVEPSRLACDSFVCIVGAASGALYGVPTRVHALGVVPIVWEDAGRPIEA